MQAERISEQEWRVILLEEGEEHSELDGGSGSREIWKTWELEDGRNLSQHKEVEESNRPSRESPRCTVFIFYYWNEVGLQECKSFVV